MNELREINVVSGVNDIGNGFVTVTAVGADRTMLVGQMSPDDMRRQALVWMEVAEAADQDAAVLRVLRKLGLPDELAGVIVTELRNSREQ